MSLSKLRNPNCRLPLATILFLSLKIVALASFSITGSSSRLKPGATLKLLREDLDNRSQSLEGKITVQTDHSFQAAFQGEPGLFSLELSPETKITLAIDSDQHIELKDNPANPGEFSNTGSPDTDRWRAYESFRKESLARLVYPPREKLNRAKDSGGSQLALLAQAEVDGYDAHKRELTDFVIEHAGTSIALYATSLRWDNDYRLKEIQQRVNEFAQLHPNLAITASMQNRLKLFALTAVGSPASPLAGKTLAGDSISLAQFDGKIVLIDFWASWCVPCRVENRHYPELLKEYSSRGFAILAVNLDENRSDWVRASKQDAVSWPQISDLQGLKSPLAKAYNVTALPMSFLLDRNGRILARNLRGGKLAEELKKLFP